MRDLYKDSSRRSIRCFPTMAENLCSSLVEEQVGCVGVRAYISASRYAVVVQRSEGKPRVDAYIR
jgi:hypothetical protein